MSRPSRTMTISLPPDLAERIDRTADAEGRTRSELLREAARQYIDRRARLDAIYAFGDAFATQRGLSEEEVLEAVVADRRKRRAWGAGTTADPTSS